MPGDIADWMIEQMIWGCNDEFEDDYEEREPRTATEVAEERLRNVAKDRKVRDLNKGVMEW